MTNTLILVSNIAEASIWFLCSLVLILVQTNTNSKEHRPYQISKWLMSAAFMAGALSIVFGLFFGRYNSDRIEVLNIYSLLFFYMITSMMMISILSLYNINRNSRLSLIRLFGPTAVLLAINFLLTLTKGSPSIFSFEELRIAIGNSFSVALRVIIIISVLLGVVVVVINFIKVRREYIEMLNNFFSSELELRKIKWIDKSFITIILTMMLSIGSYLTSSPCYDIFYGIVLTIVLVGIMAQLLNYERVFILAQPAVDFANTQQDDSKELLSDATGFILQKWASRADKPFLTSTLSLADVSKMTGLSKHHISIYINTRLGMRFNVWVNSLRIKEVERLLADHRCDNTLPHIAKTTGFADLTAMSNAFKRIVGATPTQYRQNCNINNGEGKHP